MSDTKLRTDERTELHENVCLDDEVDELQNHLCDHRRQRLRNRADERQDDFNLQQNRERRLRDSINEIREREDLSHMQAQQSTLRSETIVSSVI